MRRTPFPIWSARRDASRRRQVGGSIAGPPDRQWAQAASAARQFAREDEQVLPPDAITGVAAAEGRS